jgi:hypothetical protein
MSLELKEAIADIEEKTNQKMLSLRRAHNGILKAGDGVNYGFQAFNICEEKYKQLEKEYNALKKNYKILEHEKNSLKKKYHEQCKIQCKKACDAKIETVKSLLKKQYDALCDQKLETMEEEKEAKVQAMKNIYLTLINEMKRIG